jgi:hypothetical protein
VNTDPDEMYRSPVIAVIGWLIVGIPAAALIAITYWTGTWMGGGLLGGTLSVLVTGGVVWYMWGRALRKRQR